MSIPTELFFGYVVYYLPFAVSRSICKFDNKFKSKLYTELTKNAKLSVTNRLNRHNKEEYYDRLIKNKFLLPTNSTFKMDVINSSLNTEYFFKLFEITRIQLFDMIREELDRMYGNGKLLTNGQIEYNLRILINETGVLSKIKFIHV